MKQHSKQYDGSSEEWLEVTQGELETARLLADSSSTAFLIGNLQRAGDDLKLQFSAHELPRH